MCVFVGSYGFSKDGAALVLFFRGFEGGAGLWPSGMNFGSGF